MIPHLELISREYILPKFTLQIINQEMNKLFSKKGIFMGFQFMPQQILIERNLVLQEELAPQKEVIMLVIHGATLAVDGQPTMKKLVLYAMLY